MRSEPNGEQDHIVFDGPGERPKGLKRSSTTLPKSVVISTQNSTSCALLRTSPRTAFPTMAAYGTFMELQLAAILDDVEALVAEARQGTDT